VALEDLHRRRLAGAVGSQEAEHLAALHFERDPADRLVHAVGLRQVVNHDRGARRHLSHHGNLRVVLCGCIDIGSNTTRVLVADARDGRLRELLQRRAFTRIGKGLKPGGEIPRAKIEEVADVVASHRMLAEQVGAAPVRTVATAAIRGAANRDEFAAVVSERGGVELCILDGEEEARLAFLGATRTLGRALDGLVGVVDVGAAPPRSPSDDRGRRDVVGVGAAGLRAAGRRLRAHGPAAAAELQAMGAHAHGALDGLDVRPGRRPVAVGGSAASCGDWSARRWIRNRCSARARAVAGAGRRGRGPVRRSIQNGYGCFPPAC
jgi:exopolyphosphatase/guanosine-5'-triphosphate,3'-diphosphate pyrophosphatase